ncbi:membrane-associated proteins in eicosanoid and glutathione metabolism [Macrolepiota fuliginosa MF-IS2]|uniref:Membrane-associated proteins in eicosanoid and glutathione metabolism n=1 Tax=Macrolepiota fuliginosa MF-IS2 TaxID=1400762 RepID=A0A9P6C6V1_9AGAR|nr:membrane-associated proteins in eicosanoid and glutathione metabolism [Macrolepiota fuliginosa MF-IS2]
MSTTIQIPQDFYYVGATIVSTVWVLLGQGFTVGKYRRLSGIKYPQLYAEKAEAEANKDAQLFNCAQRAHQNTLENIPIIWATTIIVGLRMPVIAASACGLWSLSRISYTIGYLSGDPKKRVTPLYGLGTIGSLGLTLTATVQAVQWIWQGVSAKLGH